MFQVVSVSKRFRLLDLYAGAGGAARGYQMAGFHVTGVDHVPQPRYAGDVFIKADALEYIAEHGREYDAIHASPPCQAYTQSALSQRNRGKQYPRLIEATRNLLSSLDVPWVIENVPDAPLRPDYILCGCLFGLQTATGLKLWRERWFETSWQGFELRRRCQHDGPSVCVVGHGTPSWVRKKLGRNQTITEAREAMGIDWMNRNELSEANPAGLHKLGGGAVDARAHGGGMTQALTAAVSQPRQTREHIVEIEAIVPVTLDSEGAWSVNFDDKRWVALVNASIWDVLAFIGTQP